MNYTLIKMPSMFKTMKAQNKYYLKYGLDSRLSDEITDERMLHLYVYMFNDIETQDHSLVINGNTCLIKRNFMGCVYYDVDYQINDAFKFFRKQRIKYPYYDLILDLGVAMPTYSRGFKMWVVSCKDGQSDVSLKEQSALC